MPTPEHHETHQTTGAVHLTTPSHSTYLSSIRALVSALATEVGFTQDEVTKIEMAVDEACANVIKHAYAPDKQWCWQHREPEIRLTVHAEKDSLIVEINDHGQRFDLTSYRPMDIETRIHEMRTDGFGVAIMRQFMDELTYTSNNQTGNTLRLVKHLKKT